MEKEYKICVLAYGKLYEIAQQAKASLEYEDTELEIRRCTVDTLSETVEQAAAGGCEVFIAGAANAAEFNRCSNEHLVEIRLSNIDYLRAIKKAAAIGSRPAIAAYRYGRGVDLPLLEELSGRSLELILYEDSAELYQGIRDSEADVIIGASHAAEIAGELEKKSVLLYFSEDSFLSAVRRARLLAQDLHKNARMTMITRAVLNDTPFGMAVTDEEGKVLYANRALQQQAGLERARLRGRVLSELVPSLATEAFLQSGLRLQDQKRLVNGAMLRCVQTRIEDRGRMIGVLTTLYPDNARRSRTETSGEDSFRARYSWKDATILSPAMKAFVRQAKTYAELPDPVLIEGEAGTGKSFLTQCMHTGSSRATAPYLTVNTAALPDQDVVRVLFGSEDASGVHPGLLELAGNGTVVLLELGHATETVKSCILEAVSNHQFRRLGGVAPVLFRAKVLTVLDSPSESVKIREDLKHWLSVFRLSVPPLRERQEDLPSVFARLALEGSETRKVGPELAEVLRFYSWPGNLPELTSVCRRYDYLLREAKKPGSGTRQRLLVQAIGEGELFSEYLRQFPVLRDPAKAEPAELVPPLQHMKHLLKYNDNRLAEIFSLSRTTLWRIRKAAEQNG